MKRISIDTKSKIVYKKPVPAKSRSEMIDPKMNKIVVHDIALTKSKQKKIDTKKEKIAADNIDLAKSRQKKIDIKKEKIVAENIIIAKAKQAKIDSRKEKIVAENIVLAKSKQKKIDIKKEKIVAKNIALAKTIQKNIDTRNEKIVANNISIAKTEQKDIDIEKEKIVADNINLAKAEQKLIDIKKKKIVADNIDLAKSKQKKVDIKKEKIVAANIIHAKEKSDEKLAVFNEWIKNVSKTSYDVMWDWDIATDRVYVGDSIKEVFGYNVTNKTVNFNDFSQCLLPGDKEAIEEKLSKALASDSKKWDDSFKFKRKDGSIASTTSRASIIRNETGKATQLIGAIQDVSRLQELQKKLEEEAAKKNEFRKIFLMAARLSVDVIWDWNILTDEMFIGDGFEELFGYSVKNNKGRLADWTDHIHPDEKEIVEKALQDALASSVTSWEQAFRLIRADGSIAKINERASIIRHTDGKAYRMIGAIQDLSPQKELEEKLAVAVDFKGKLHSAYTESFKFIFNTSSDVFYDNDLLTGEVIISDAYEKEFGYKITGNMTPAKDWISHIHPDDKAAVNKDYSRMLASEDIEWKYTYRFLKADNSIANVLSSSFVLRNADGKAYRIIGYMQDINKQKVLEERQMQEIKLKEKQIVEATEAAKQAERMDLGKELHDNVNQLLGASRLYLDMAKRGGENSDMYLSRSSEYTLTAIEEIRKISQGLTTEIIETPGLCESIEAAARDMMEVSPVKISCALESFIENRVNNKFKQNVFRIVQEQLNNIVKHARATEVIISLSQRLKSIMLSISDNGVGFDTRKKQKGIGIGNIKNRAASYNGTADFISQPGQGCVLSVTFPVTDTLLNKN